MNVFVFRDPLSVTIAAAAGAVAAVFMLYLIKDALRGRRRRKRILRWRRRVEQVWLLRVTSGEWSRWLPLASRARRTQELQDLPPEWLD